MKVSSSAFIVPTEGSERQSSDHGQRSHLKENLQDRREHLEMERVVVEDLIKPLMFVLKYFLPFHDSIQYDVITRSFVFVKGSLIRKFVCMLWQSLVLFRLGVKAIPSLNVGESSDSQTDMGMTTVAKVAYFVFITFQLLNFYTFFTKTKCICKIFNSILTLVERLNVTEKAPSRIRLVRVIAHLAWVFAISYVLMTGFLYSVQVLPEKINYGHHMRPVNGSVENGITSSSRNKVKLDFIGSHEKHDSIITELIAAIANLINIFSWMMIFFHWAIWAAMYRELFLLFYWRINTKGSLGQYIVIPHEIRTFNKISVILEDFNKIYGLTNVFGAVVVVTYISLSVKHAFGGLQHFLDMNSGLHLILSYVPMIVASILLAEVQRVAGAFAGIIKDQYGIFTKECGDAAESLCGIAIVHYDLSTSNIGCKGLGFFTVSYQFITTILSVIMSYSILIVQLFPHENSVEV